MRTETAEHCLQEARRIRAEAEASEFPDIKVQLLMIVAAYERLADYLEPKHQKKSS